MELQCNSTLNIVIYSVLFSTIFLSLERKTTSKYVREEDMQILGKNRVRAFRDR